MREYTPTMYQAQDSYVNGSMSKGRYEGNRARRRSEYRAEFHRWLAETVRAAKAEAWDEGQEAVINDDLGDWEVAPSITRNPYEAEEVRHVDQ